MFFERVISLWPLLIVLVVLLLAFLWYNQIKNMRRRHDKHDNRKMIGIINPIILLGIVTLLIIMLLALPFFFERLEVAVEEQNNDEVVIDPKNIYNETFQVKGMESHECEVLLKEKLNAHAGIKMSEISYVEKNATIIYDTTLINRKQIKDIVEATGFSVKNID